MRKYSVAVSWMVRDSGRFQVEAESEEEAKNKVIDDNDEISEDYDIESVSDLGPVIVEKPEPEDPNQMKFEL